MEKWAKSIYSEEHISWSCGYGDGTEAAAHTAAAAKVNDCDDFY
jgi:hypothetical protein